MLTRAPDLVHTTADCGHFMAEEAPDVVARGAGARRALEDSARAVADTCLRWTRSLTLGWRIDEREMTLVGPGQASRVGGTFDRSRAIELARRLGCVDCVY